MALHLTDHRELLADQKPRPLADWSEEIGLAIFFNPMTHSKPEITSPAAAGFEVRHFSHWIPLPKIFRCYRTREALLKQSEMEPTP